jgi:hypothetical protein
VRQAESGLAARQAGRERSNTRRMLLASHTRVPALKCQPSLPAYHHLTHLKTPRAPGSRAARAISPPSHSSARSGRTG